MSYKQALDISVSFMDGVKVKISEKYKPPPRINLAMTYSQRILANKQVRDHMPTYDFCMESLVKGKMSEWRAAKHQTALNHKEKLAKIKEKRQKLAEERLELLKSSNQTSEEETNTNRVTDAERNRQNYTSGGVLIPTQVNTNKFLTPIPLTKQEHICNDVDKSPFNISDFEGDTSSPFDNMELKTINDLEELRLVLENEDKKSKPNYVNPTYASQINCLGYNLTQGLNNHSTTYNNSTAYTNGYSYYDSALQPVANSYPNIEYSSSFDAPTPVAPAGITAAVSEKAPFRSVPDIMKALQTEFSSSHLVDDYTLPCHSVNKSSPNVELDNPYDSLSKPLRGVCDVISSMGFPLARVARACKNIGDDQKKIVDHLLTLSELLVLGFPEDKVSAALMKCDGDRDKALEVLIS